MIASLRQTSAALALCALTAFAPGCDLIDALTDPGETLITVFSRHHASPRDGTVPDLGGEGEMRVFENDEGWTVHLIDGVITTRGVTLHRCDGTEAPVELYFGTLAEDLSGADLDRRTVGGTKVVAAEYCGLTVHYGPFAAGNDSPPPANDLDPMMLDGNTVFLSGYAERDGVQVPFEIGVDGDLDVYTDLDVGPDQPLRVTGDEPFPLELTISKTYDRFFEGIDFETLEEGDLVEQARAILELETVTDIAR